MGLPQYRPNRTIGPHKPWACEQQRDRALGWTLGSDAEELRADRGQREVQERGQREGRRRGGGAVGQRLE